MSGWFAPGRIELLGKHTDHAGGNVLVCAVDRGVTCRITPSDEGLTARSSASPEVVDLPLASIDTLDELPRGHWGHYLRATAARLAANFGPLAPARLEITSDLPLASGMSSSSALVVACAMALVEHNGFDTTELWRSTITDDIQLAGYLACVENGKSFGALAGSAGVGTRGGSEDHTAMLCSVAGELGQFSFNPPSLVRRVALGEQWRLVVAVSGVAAEKTGAALAGYNAASLTAAECLRRWNSAGHAHHNLAAALASSPDAEAELEALVADDAQLLVRLRQFVAESTEIIPAAVDALAAGRMAEFGEQVARSQSLAGEALRNQVPQTEALVALAVERGAVAASSFGAGFGGSVWALVPASTAEPFAGEWLAAYRAVFPDEGSRAEMIVTRPSASGHSL